VDAGAEDPLPTPSATASKPSVQPWGGHRAPARTAPTSAPTAPPLHFTRPD
jgi:hypothetical protein